ncbi:hypothetical protein [Erwinia phage vB_Ea277G]|nr:hypothetical protein [Erwinia phage vB_Ea277G]
MSDNFEMPSDDVLREAQRRENNFWKHALPYWMENCLGVPSSPLLDGRVREIKHVSTLDGFLRNYPGFDEPPYLLKIAPEVKYLVKDPKEPYRRSPSLEAMKGYKADPSKYPNAMPCIIRQPIRLNKVTWHLFPFRNTTPQTTFTHPERHHQYMRRLEQGAVTYYTVGGPNSALRDVLLKNMITGLEYSAQRAWSKHI